MSTPGVFSTVEDTMMGVGDIMSTAVEFSTLGVTTSTLGIP